MKSVFRPALVSLLWLTLITGAAYPLVVTVVAQSLFADQANGSLLHDSSGQVTGSRLLAQPLAGAQWFQPRPSAGDYATVSSSASNLSAGNPALRQRVAAAAAAADNGPLPMALATTSGSGLDPHLPPEAALYQVPRIAQARQVPAAQLEALVAAHTERPWFGPAVVNVLALNQALAQNPAGSPR